MGDQYLKTSDILIQVTSKRLSKLTFTSYSVPNVQTGRLTLPIWACPDFWEVYTVPIKPNSKKTAARQGEPSRRSLISQDASDNSYIRLQHIEPYRSIYGGYREDIRGEEGVLCGALQVAIFIRFLKKIRRLCILTRAQTRQKVLYLWQQPKNFYVGNVKKMKKCLGFSYPKIVLWQMWAILRLNIIK